jgi:hypothetical protein
MHGHAHLSGFSKKSKQLDSKSVFQNKPPVAGSMSVRNVSYGFSLLKTCKMCYFNQFLLGIMQMVDAENMGRAKGQMLTQSNLIQPRQLLLLCVFISLAL